MSLISQKEKLESQIRRDWDVAWEFRSRAWRHLNNRTIDQYLQDNRDIFNGYKPTLTSDEEENKANYFKKKLRRKVLAAASLMASANIGLDFEATNTDHQIDRVMSSSIEDLYEFSLLQENFDYHLYLALLQAGIDGTSCTFEDIEWGNNLEEQIYDINLETGEVKWKVADRFIRKGPKTVHVPIEEIYLANPFLLDVQEQPYIFRRRIADFSAVEDKFGGFPGWADVQKGHKFFLSTSGTQAGQDRESGSDTEDIAEVVWYWKKRSGKNQSQMVILVNGTIITRPDMPMPYPHGRYPLSWQPNEIFGEIEFAYGNSICNIGKDEQELVNDFWNSAVDLTHLKMKPPLFTNNAELVDTDLSVPGTVQTKGIDDRIETIPELTKGVGQSEFNMLTMAEKQVDEDSIDPLLTAQQPSSSPTATQVNAIMSSGMKMQGGAEQTIGNFILQHALLRIPNMLYMVAHDPDFASIVLSDVVVKGKPGQRKLIFVQNVEMPQSSEILKMNMDEGKLLGKESGQDMAVDNVFINLDRLDEYRYHVKISPSPKIRRSASRRLQVILDKNNIYAQNPLINQRERTKDLIKALGDDPERLLMPEEQMQPSMQPGMGQEQPKRQGPMTQMSNTINEM